MDTTKIVEKIKYGNVELKMKTTTLQAKSVDPSVDEQFVFPDSEYGGLSSVTVTGVTNSIDKNIIPGNIRKGKVILGVEGDMEPDKPDQSKTVKPTKEEQEVHADRGYELLSVTVEGVTSDIDENIQADNIRYGVEILGVVGSMEQKEDLDAELNEQESLLSDLQSQVDNLPDREIDVSKTTATTADVMQGKKFYNAQGEFVEGVYVDISKIAISCSKSCRDMFKGYPYEDMSWIKNLNTTGVRTMEQMFYECKNVTSLDLSHFVTDDVTIMNNMFFNCTNLEILNLSSFNTSNVTMFDGFCNNCSSLKTVVGTIDLISVSSAPSLLSRNNKLETFMVKNIRKNLQLGLSTSSGSKLSNESLINAIQQLWDNTDNVLGGSRKLTLSTTSKENIANIYVKLIDITDEMRADDQYIDNKKPCVVCESADEGAMTLTEYIISKNWAVA